VKKARESARPWLARFVPNTYGVVTNKHDA